MQEVLRVDNLSQTGDGAACLDRMHFSLMKGEILGIIGLHDSGRSTLVNILSGNLPLMEGEIYIDCRRTAIHSIQDAQRCGVFCVRERPSLIPELTVAENMCLLTRSACNALSFPQRSVCSTACHLLDALHIEVSRQTPCGGLPVPLQHRMEIARAYYVGARILILHDIMQSYNEQEEAELIGLLNWLRKRDVSILITGSRPEQMAMLCDRIVVTRVGRDVDMLLKEDCTSEKIEKALLGVSHMSRSRCQEAEIGSELLAVSHVSNRGLKDVSFRVYEGEIVGFVEKNGLAKSVADLFNGRNPHTEGCISVNGRSFCAGKRVVLDQSCRAGYVEYYKNCIFPRMTLRDNLTIAALPMFSRGGYLSARLERFAVSEFAKECGITEEELGKRMSSQSSFLQMKVCYYRWLLTKARFLVMNDVFLGTDVLMRGNLNEFFHLAQKRKMGLLLTSSNITYLRSVCTRIETIEDGRLIGRELCRHAQRG